MAQRRPLCRVNGRTVELADGDTLPVATATDIWAGTDTGKIVTAKALRDAQVPQNLTYAASIAWDTAMGFNAKVLLGGNGSFATPASLVEGLAYTLRLKQDGSGNRAPTWSSAFSFGADGAPMLSTAAGKEDILVFLCIDAATPVLAFTGIRKGF